MTTNRIKIEAKNEKDQDVVVFVAKPTDDESKQAHIIGMKAFGDAVKSGVLVKEAMDKQLREQGVWDDEKEAEVKKIVDGINDNLRKLREGGIKLSEARKAAVRVRQLRMEQLRIMSVRDSYDDMTADAIFKNTKFDYLVSVCVKTEEGDNYFKDLDDYHERNDSPMAFEAASKLAQLLEGFDEDWEAKLPENKFLKEHNFVNDEMRLVNSEGDFVTVDNKVIDENFRYVDDEGNFIDVDGNKVDEDGLPIVEAKPFLDDDGEPIQPKKKRGRPRKEED
jgi:hypothetical protein